MSRASAHSEPSDLTPELAAKLRDVEQEFERLHQTASLRHRWFLLGFIPRLMQLLSALALLWTFVAAALFIFARYSSTGLANPPEPWLYAMQFIGSVLGALFPLVVSTWAMRYCQARADGKL